MNKKVIVLCVGCGLGIASIVTGAIIIANKLKALREDISFLNERVSNKARSLTNVSELVLGLDARVNEHTHQIEKIAEIMEKM